jgi:AcrR family transcriptional regulator
MSPKESSREEILDAAEEVVLELGAGHMTLNIVAEKAGISKGGLMYNFPTKEALLTAMVQRMSERIKDQREQKQATLPSGPAQQLKAHVLSMLEPQPDLKGERVKSALLAAAAINPKLLIPVRDEYERFLANLASSGMRFERAAVIALAADGLRILELLKVSALPSQQRDAVIAEMLRLADEAQKGVRTDSETGTGKKG